MKKLEDAVRSAVHNFPGGAQALAEHVGIGAQVLRNKINPNNDTHHLSLSEAVRVVHATADFGVVHAFAEEFGGVFVPLGQCGDARTSAVLADISAMSAGFGDLIREVADDISDGVLTRNEMQRIQDEANDLRRALGQLMADLAAMQQQSIQPL